jgi:hypothetical protein
MGSITGDLEERVLTQFDTLVQRGEIIWQDSAPRYVEATPFDVPAHPDLAYDFAQLIRIIVQIPRRRRSDQKAKNSWKQNPKACIHRRQRGLQAWILWPKTSIDSKQVLRCPAAAGTTYRRI